MLAETSTDAGGSVLLSPVVLVTIAIFVGVSSVAWFVLSRVSGDDQAPAETRLERLKDPRKALRELEDEEKSRSKNEALTAALEKAANPLADKMTGNEAEMGKLREKLMNAGFRRESAPLVYKMIQAISIGAFLLLSGVAGFVMDGLTQAMMLKIAGGMVLGYCLPAIALWWMRSKRMEAIFLGLPDALDLMVVCVEAGLGIDQALRKVADEMAKSHKAIGEEFAIANSQLQFGRTRSEVLMALGYRSGVEDLKQLASILIQADRFGSSVANALRVQSDSMRTKRRQIAEEKAAKTAVKMIFPLVIFIFPGIFVVLLGPAAISMYRQLLNPS
ncbi:MAG: type II secretion system F family protein [Planctomycetota bacterium]